MSHTLRVMQNLIQGIWMDGHPAEMLVDKLSCILEVQFWNHISIWKQRRLIWRKYDDLRFLPEETVDLNYKEKKSYSEMTAKWQDIFI